MSQQSAQCVRVHIYHSHYFIPGQFYGVFAIGKKNSASSVAEFYFNSHLATFVSLYANFNYTN